MLHVLAHLLVHVVRAAVKQPKGPADLERERSSREVQDSRAHLRRLEDLRGKGSPALLSSQGALAELLAGSGDWAEAFAVLKQAAEVVSATPLERLEREAGANQAELVLQLGVRLAARRHGESHPATGAALVQLAALYERMARLPLAEKDLARALAIEQAAFGGDHVRAAAVLERLARVVSAQGRSREALPLWGRALAIREKAASPDDPSLATALVGLARAQAAAGLRDAAETCLMRAVSLLKREKGGESPEVQMLLDELEALYR